MAAVYEALNRLFHRVDERRGPDGPTRHWLDVTPVQSADKPCAIDSLDVKAHVHGVYADVEQTIVVRNPNKRPISAPFSIAIPDGAVVCGYALDIDGVMVDGVVVPKERARVVFEAEQRRGADPGLVEAVRGNVYRTRVYPVPPEGVRTMRLRYVAPLQPGGEGPAVLELPMPAERLGHRSVRVDVEMLDAPAPVVLGLGGVEVKEARGCWSVEHADDDVAAGEHVRVALPELPESFAVIERDAHGDVWFSASEALPSNEAAPADAPQIRSLAVLWDASGSRADADHVPEIDLLRAYCAAESLQGITLVLFGDCVREVRSFGSADELAAYLAEVRYDGGTNFGALSRELASVPGIGGGAAAGGACVLFTDGVDTLCADVVEFPAGCDVLAVVSGDERDVESMRHACAGLAFNLVQAPRDAGELSRAFAAGNPSRTWKPVGEGLEDVCDASIPGSGRRTVVGKLAADKASISLGGGGAVRVLNADDARDGGVLACAWAARRVAELSVRADDNADELLALGRRFGVVSPATSLLVLETLDQWLRYDIEPPASLEDMHARWQRMKAGEMHLMSDRELADRHRDDLEYEWAELLRWWELDYPMRREPDAGAGSFCTQCGNRLGDRDRFCSRCGASVPPAVYEGGVRFEGPGEPDAAGSFDGGAQPTFSADPGATGRMPALSEALDFVRGAALRSPAPAMRAEMAMEDAPMPMMAMDSASAAPDAMPRAADVPSGPSVAVNIKPWTPDAPYLKGLDAAAEAGADAARDAYFAQRAEYRTSPSFFLDCAGWFMAHGDDEFGACVLSNLAELRIEDAALLRVMGWRLREAGKLEEALSAFRRVAKLRSEDSQSYRDIALTLDELARAAHARGDEAAARERAEEAGALYRKIALTPWDRRPMAVALFAVEEYNVLRAWAGAQAWKTAPDLPSLGEKLEGVLDCDLRITLAWDADETDVDIHVTEPSGEEAYYANRRTYDGGRVSEDITDGFGPELYEIRRAREGDYVIRAHYYASHQQAVFGPATCTLTVYTDWGRPAQSRCVTTTRLDQEHEMLPVGTASYRSAGGDSLSR